MPLTFFIDTDGSRKAVSPSNPIPTTGAISSAIPTGNNTIGLVGGNQIAVAVELTRPADTTAYAALDSISNSTSAPTVLNFADIFRAANGTGYITKAELWTDNKATTARIRAHIYNATVTPANDNSSFLLLYANKAIKQGHIDLPALATEDPTNSTGAYALNSTIRLAVDAASEDTDLYVSLETLDAFTPASGQKFYLKLTMECN